MKSIYAYLSRRTSVNLNDKQCFGSAKSHTYTATTPSFALEWMRNTWLFSAVGGSILAGYVTGALNTCTLACVLLLAYICASTGMQI
jgi:hypothetical protein